MGIVIETQRLYLRKMTDNDFYDIAKILQDEEVMYAYEVVFSGVGVKKWIETQKERYEKDGVGLFAVVKKDDYTLIGQCGLTYQKIPQYEKEVLEIGYLFNKTYWHKGYAIEAAMASKAYAFEILKAKEVYSLIRDTNTPSKNVALRNNMIKVGEFKKRFNNKDMLHYIYKVQNEEYDYIKKMYGGIL